MRLTITRRIVLGVAVVLILGVLSMLLLYQGLITVQQALVRLADVDEPLQSAAQEMEINVNGTCMGVLRYLDQPDETYLRLIDKDERDFKAFHAEYEKLAVSDQEKGLAQRADRIHQKLQATARSLIAARDKQESLLVAVQDAVEEIDGIIDDKLQAQLMVEDPDRVAKLMRLSALEIDMAELNMSLAHSLRSNEESRRRFITVNEREFRESLEQVQGLNLTSDERHWVEAIGPAFERVMADMREALALNETLHAGSTSLLDSRAEMDRLLDAEIQVIARDALLRPRQEADAAVVRVLRNTFWLAGLFLASALGVTWILARTVTSSLARLRSGTEAITHGDLNYRIEVEGRDEFADLGNAFNIMVAELQATTVSKLALEASDRRLQETVQELRVEIAERRRAQEEQALLQDSLRRAEAWSELGVLLAGVIHQVRNPLFGISSIVDAMDARFGAREEYQRYVGRLREQVTRISALLQDLLEYAKPSQAERSPEAVGHVIEEALRACRPLAEQRGVQVQSHIDRATPPLAADRPRLVRAFECLIENALQHSPPGGKVEVTVRTGRADGTSIECTIADSGPGFSEEDLCRAFEPFFSRRPGGTGLGLAIAQSIVTDHAAQIVAANRPGGGAVLTVHFSPGESQRQPPERADDRPSNSAD